MIPAEYYYSIYLLIVSLITFPYTARYLRMSPNRVDKSLEVDYSKVIALTIFMILFIGLRPVSDVFADMPGYAKAMLDHRFEDLPIAWDQNYIFQPMMAFLSSIGASQQTPIVILAAINFGATFFAMKKMFPNDTMLAMLVFFGAFSTFCGATNGLKAGCAMAFFLLALAYRENKVLCVLFLFLTMGYHHSMQLPLAAFILCTFYKNTKLYFAFWIICLFIAALHITFFMNFFAGWTDDHGAEYLYTLAGSRDSEFSGKLGFRYDFIIYSSVPIIIGYIGLFKKKIISENYQFLLNLYLFVNGIWMLCMYANFTNRIAGLSWGMLPVLIIYPFLKEKWNNNQYKTLYKVVIGHLSFTLFMQIIYY